MKKITIYMEIAGAARDEQGIPQPAGLSLTIGGPTDEDIIGDEYPALLEHIRVEDLLWATFLTDMYPASACPIIMPHDYNAKYGDR